VLNLKTKGFENAAALLGGFDAWKNAGLPVETGKTQ
jgi:rhodanese-related sulfurtransferase